MLRKWPTYLSYDLDEETRPRAEFLRACGFQPLFKGLPFLLSAEGSDLSSAVELKPDVYFDFKEKFTAMWLASEEEKRLEYEAALAANKNWQTILAQKKVGRGENWAQEDIGTIDVDDLLEESEIYFD